MIIDNTPIEKYEIQGRTIHVKREDLCCPFPGPGFSKIRGLYQFIKNKLDYSLFPISNIGVVDTFHSKAGWGTAYICNKLKIPCSVYYPHFKREDPGFVREYQINAQKLGAKIYPLQATKSAVLYYQARKHFRGYNSFGIFLPNGLKLKETVDGTFSELEKLPVKFKDNTLLVVSVSSGTIGAALLRWVKGKNVHLCIHMGYDRSVHQLCQYMSDMAGFTHFPSNTTVINEHYKYSDKVEIECPFPCNPYYDLKAWKWLIGKEGLQFSKNYDKILFWNIGE